MSFKNLFMENQGNTALQIFLNIFLLFLSIYDYTKSKEDRKETKNIKCMAMWCISKNSKNKIEETPELFICLKYTLKELTASAN